jgi:hypothetical protein
MPNSRNENAVSEKLRDVNADLRQAVEAKIALHESIGEDVPEHLLNQRAQWQSRNAEPTPAAPPVEELERKDADEADEHAVPRRPGRPRKPSEE